MINAVIYARYSSHNQSECSIEGQLEVCKKFAKTGTKENRDSFERMIRDSEKQLFQVIIVYQLDRFARDRYTSVIYKKNLKKLGIRVLSARENITEDASGVLMESVLEGMAEYFSKELGQKVKRGMRVNAECCY